MWTIILNTKYVGTCSDFFTLCCISDFTKDRQISWYWKLVVSALVIDFRKISFSVFIVFLCYTCGDAQTQYHLEPRHKRMLKHCGKARRINASEKQDKMNIPEAVAINVHINTPPHTDTLQQKVLHPINADIRWRDALNFSLYRFIQTVLRSL